MITANDAATANWICAALSLAILLVRLVLARVRDKAFSLASLLVVLSIAVIVTRIVVIHTYLDYGTAGLVREHKIKDPNWSRIRTGSILVIISRFLDTSFYWLQVSVLLLFYSNICQEFRWRTAIRICWVLIILSYIAVVLVTFLECHPFHLYWQVSPPPGSCVKAYAQLFLQCIFNIILDLYLLVISYPLLSVSFQRQANWSQKLRVGLLLILGLFCTVVTAVRVAYVLKSNSYQPVRSFWASIQILVASFVANTPTVYGCLRVIGRRKSEQRTRRSSRPEIWTSSSLSPQSTEHTPPEVPVSQLIANIRNDFTANKEQPNWARQVP